MHHKNPKRIQDWMKDLYTNQYVGRIYSNTFIENTKPAIYFLTKKSRALLKDKEGYDTYVLNRVYKTFSKAHVDHCMFIADIHFTLLSQLGKNESLQFFTKVDLVGYNHFPHPLPDAYFAIKDKDKTRRYFLKVIEEKLPRKVLPFEIKPYIEYEKKTWSDNTNGLPLPAFLIVAPNEPRKRIIYQLISDAIPDGTFFVTTKDNIKYGGLTPGVWQGVK